MAAGECGGRLPPRSRGVLARLTAPARSRTTSAESTSRRSIALESRHIETLQESLDRLRLEVDELRASRKRLVLAADADRRRIERDLHDGRAAAPGRPRGQPAARATVGRRRSRRGEGAPRRDGARRRSRRWTRRQSSRTGSTRRCSRRAASPRRCARRRRAPASRPTSKSRRTRATRPRSRATVYLCCLEVLERAGAGARATVDGAGRGGSGRLRGRRGRRAPRRDSNGCATASRRSAAGSTIRSEPGRGIRVSGSLPLSR